MAAFRLFFTSVDRFQYGYNQASSRQWKAQLAAPDGGQDEYYGYDGLQQVKSFARGNVNINRTAIAGVAEQTEAFDYDATGNWERYQKTESGASVLDQSRTNNQDNQMVQIDGSASGIGYDLAGNATLLPPTEDGDWAGSYSMVWDAWQRLVAIRSEDDTSTIATYGYDGLTRRLLHTVGGLAQQCLYSKEWKPLLEWDPTDPSTTRKAYMWGAMHRDELVLRDRDVSGSLDERLYVTHDYFNPTAIADAAGAVQERYAYSAFGVRRIMDAEFATIGASAFDWDFAFQGQFRDQESGFYNYGYRYYSPELGRWFSRDPIGESGGANVYAFVSNAPVDGVDHLGLAPKRILVILGPNQPPGGNGPAINEYWVTWTSIGTRDQVLNHVELGKADYKQSTGKECNWNEIGVVQHSKASPVSATLVKTLADQYPTDIIYLAAHGIGIGTDTVGILLYSHQYLNPKSSFNDSPVGKVYTLASVFGNTDNELSDLRIACCHNGKLACDVRYHNIRRVHFSNDPITVLDMLVSIRAEVHRQCCVAGGDAVPDLNCNLEQK